MNEILQKRIEEAAKRYAWSHDTIGVDKETFHTEASQKHPIPIDKHVRVPIQHEMEIAFKCAAHFILNNQWISVDEALPKESGDYLVIVKQSSDSEAYFHEISTYNATDNIWFYVGKLIVTHWAPIPSLEGGKE